MILPRPCRVMQGESEYEYMLKWRKVDKQGRPARRNCNSFEEHDYINDGLLGLKIINNSFGYDKEPWTLVTKKGSEIGKFKRLKDAKAYAETLDESEPK